MAADRLDAVLTHPWFGLVAAGLLLGLGILGTFELSGPLQHVVDRLFAALGSRVALWVAAPLAPPGSGRPTGVRYPPRHRGRAAARGRPESAGC